MGTEVTSESEKEALNIGIKGGQGHEAGEAVEGISNSMFLLLVAIGLLGLWFVAVVTVRFAVDPKTVLRLLGF